jgi:general stress protein YciG
MTKNVQITTSSDTGTGKGWHGDPLGHAKAGRKGGMKSSGNFRNNPQRAAAAGRLGGRISPGNFKNDPERARAAGRKGGSH